MARLWMFVLTAVVVVGGEVLGLGSATGAAREVETAARRGTDRARSCGNPDTGLATENPNVDANS